MSVPQWCSEPEVLSDEDLRLLVQVALGVLGEGVDEGAELVGAPVSVQVDELRRLLATSGTSGELDRFVEDAAADRALAIALIRALCTDPGLRAELDVAYADRRRMLVIDPGTVLAVSLLLLVIKLRRVKVGQKGVEIELDPVRAEALSFVEKFVG